MNTDKFQEAGCTGGFHYGTIYAPCNGVYHATDERTEDNKQVYVCDACGSKAVKTAPTQRTD